MAEETQNPIESSVAPDPDAGSEDAAVKALSQLGKQADSEPEPEDETTEATEEGADAEPEGEAEPDADAEKADGLVEVEYEGEPYQVPPKLKDALLRQSDYSRKMNELGDTERRAKATLEHAETISANVDKIAEAQGQATLLNAQVDRFKGVDWAGLRASNPAEYAALQADMLSLSTQRDKALSAVQTFKEGLEHAKAQLLATERAEMVRVLSKDLKGWGDDLGAKISAYAISQGYTPDALQSLTDPKVVIALNKARQFDDLQKAKLNLKSTVREVPRVVKPGSQRPQTNVTEMAKARFVKTRSDDDAIALLEARSKR